VITAEKRGGAVRGKEKTWKRSGDVLQEGKQIGAAKAKNSKGERKRSPDREKTFYCGKGNANKEYISPKKKRRPKETLWEAYRKERRNWGRASLRKQLRRKT